MTIKDVAELLFAARGRIDFYWNFYVVVVIAIIGWLVTLKRPLSTSMKLLVSIAYLVAAAMSFAGLYSAYTFAEALRADLLRLATAAPLAETRMLLEGHSYLSHRSTALWIHLGVGAVILLGIWLARVPEWAPEGREERS